MKKILHQRTLLLFIAIFALGLLLRVMFLDRVLPGVLNDEMKFFMNAKAVWLTGSSVSGGWNPLSLNGDPHDFYDNELVPVVMAPLVGPLPYTMYYVRLPFALIATASIILIFFISSFLFDENVGLVTAAVTAVSPYLIFINRTTIESPIAMFFFLLAAVFLFTFRGWRILLTFIPLFIAFYSYIGTKVTFLPFVAVVLLWFGIFYNRKEWKKYVVLFLLSLLLVTFFAVRFRSQSVSARAGELLTPQSATIAQEVDLERKQSLTSSISPLYTNKYTLWFFHVAKNYADAFNPTTLFLAGENSLQLSLWQHGYFYLLDIVFLIAGILFMFQEKAKQAWLLLGVIFVAPLAGAIRTDPSGSHVAHGVLLFPFLLMIIGYGGYKLIFFLWQKRKLYAVGLTVIYVLFICNFLYIYFLRMPVYNAEGSVFSRRVLATYLTSEKQVAPVYVFAQEPEALLKSYLLYASLYNTKQDALALRKIIHAGPAKEQYKLGNIIFTASHHPMTFAPNATLIFENDFSKEQTFLSKKNVMQIPSIADGGAVFSIYNGKTCANLQLKRYPYGIHFSDLAVEKLPEESFCKTFITQY